MNLKKARRLPGFFVARCRPGYCWNEIVRRVVVASATGWKRQRLSTCSRAASISFH